MMKKIITFLLVSLWIASFKLLSTPLPPGPPILNVVSSANNNQACKGSTVEISAVVDSSYTTFQVGNVGPKGGNVTFDKGNDNNGWRYLQLAPYDIVLPEALISDFGCSCQNVAANNENQGGGFENFQAWLSSPCAAEWLHYIDTLHILGFDDWYIPSLTELNSIYSLSANQGLNNVEAFQDDFYWSSSPASFGICGETGGIYQKSMQSGNIISVDRNSQLGRIRLVRRFSNIPQYLWSNGSTSSSIQVSNALEGYFEYNVQVTAYYRQYYYFGSTYYDFTVSGGIGLNVYPITQSVNETIAAGDSILFNGVYLKTPGTYTTTIQTTTGCDSAVTMNLYVLPPNINCNIEAQQTQLCLGDLAHLSLPESDVPAGGTNFSLDFPNTGQYNGNAVATCNTNLGGFDLTNDFTIEFWIKAEGGFYWHLMGKNTFGDNARGWLLKKPSNQMIVAWTYVPNEFEFHNFNFNEWEHIAISFNDATNKFSYFKNGQLISVQTRDININEAPYNFIIGHELGTGNWFDGKIDNLRISNVVRYSSNFNPSETFLNDASVVAMYDFNEGQGPLAHDLSGNNRHLQLSNTNFSFDAPNATQVVNNNILWSTGETTPTVSVSPTETTTYSVTVTQGNQTCTSEVTINVNQPSSVSETITACNSYTWNGNTYTQSGNYSWTSDNASGCDSVVTLNLTITPQPEQPQLACWQTASFNATICSWDVTGIQPAQPTNLACWQSTNFNATNCSWDVSGTQPAQPTNLACWQSANFNTTSCSWVVSGTQPAQPTNLACWQSANFNTTNCSWDVTGTPAPAIITNASECVNYTWAANGEIYSASGQYSFNINCQDYTLNLTINQPSAETVNASITQGQSYNFNGQSLTNAGTYTATLQNAAGCDSVVTLNLEVNPTPVNCQASANYNVICQSESTTLIVETNANTAGSNNQQGFFEDFNDCNLDNFTFSGGTISITQNAFESSCAVGMTHYAGESPNNFYPSGLNFHYGTYSVIANATAFISDNYMYLFQGENLEGGLRVYSLPNNTDNPGFYVQGLGIDYYSGQVNVSSGQWYEMKVEVFPSIINVFINNELKFSTSQFEAPQPGRFKLGVAFSVIYDNMRFVPFGNSSSVIWSTGETTPSISVSPSETTTYSVTVTQGNQTCTSEVTITVNQSTSETVNATITEGESYSFNGQSLTTAGTFSATLQNAAGCDSTVTLNLSVVPAPPAGCYAATVVDFAQGLNSVGLPVEPARSHAFFSLGAPEMVVDGIVNFVSLGFGGSITLAFEAPVANGAGADILINEATWGVNPCNRYPETADVFASQDGINFVYLGRGCQDMSLDLGTLSWAQYIRITDVSDILSFRAGSDGYDVNGIECLNGSTTTTGDDGLVGCSLQEVVSYTPGNRKNGTPVVTSRSNPANALGLPQNNNTINFTALGFGGTIVAKFDYVVFNQPGNDLRITETSFGNPNCANYPEKARISMSLDNLNWVDLGEICQDGEVDLGALPYAQYIKIQDSSPLTSTRFSGTADGFDVDAVVLLNNGCVASAARSADEDNTTSADETPVMEAYPNPMEDETSIRFVNVQTEADIRIELFDAAGRIVLNQNARIDVEQNVVIIPTSNLAKGMYHLVVITGNDSFRERLVK